MNLDPCREVFFRSDRIDLMDKTDEELRSRLKQLRTSENLADNELLELEMLCKWYEYHSWIESAKSGAEKKQQIRTKKIPHIGCKN